MSRRCDGKKPHKFITSAARSAKRATELSGSLIIAYECYDCGAFHIGHADLSQKIAFEQAIAEARAKAKVAADKTTRPIAPGIKLTGRPLELVLQHSPQQPEVVRRLVQPYTGERPVHVARGGVPIPAERVFIKLSPEEKEARKLRLAAERRLIHKLQSELCNPTDL
jgi:hypothetical protein